jgi:hypothetical protein
MHHEGIDERHSEPPQAARRLLGDRPIEMVDLTNHENAVAPAFERVPDDFFAIAFFVARRSVHQVEPEVQSAPQRCDTLFERQTAIGQVTDADLSSNETGATELAPWRETHSHDAERSSGPERLLTLTAKFQGWGFPPDQVLELFAKLFG